MSEWWHGWVVAVGILVVAAWREITGHYARAECKAQIVALTKRLDKADARLLAFETGTVYRQMQHFCDEMTARVAASRTELEELQRRLGASLMQLAEAEERVARLLSAGVP